MTNVIGPIDFGTWYSMRQCKESIKWCLQQKKEDYLPEVQNERAMYRHFMDEVLGRKVA